MRELKFRAWERSEPKMHYEFIIVDHKWCIDEKKIGCPVNLGFQHMQEDNDNDCGWEIMQFTGLNDKLNTEIYEDDVVKITNAFNGIQHIGIIKFIKGRFVVIVDKGNGVKYTPGIYSTDIGQINVIGNVYENPELLK